jgi:hypothetical protein
MPEGLSGEPLEQGAERTIAQTMTDIVFRKGLKGFDLQGPRVRGVPLKDNARSAAGSFML